MTIFRGRIIDPQPRRSVTSGPSLNTTVLQRLPGGATIFSFQCADNAEEGCQGNPELKHCQRLSAHTVLRSCPAGSSAVFASGRVGGGTLVLALSSSFYIAPDLGGGMTVMVPWRSDVMFSAPYALRANVS